MTAPTNIDGAMMQVTEKDVIETCEVHGFPLDPNQLEVVTAVVNQILLSARKPAAKSCQTGWADICHMAKHDGVTCPDDSCDIDDGIRAAPAQSGEPVEADVVPNEIAELLTEPCWNLSRRDVSDLLKRIGSILYAAPQPSQPVEAAYDGLTEEFVDEVARLCNDAPGSRNAVYAALKNCNAEIVPITVPSAVVLDDERAAFEAHMRSRDETYLFRRDTPGSTRLGQYCRQSVQDQWETWQARAASPQANEQMNQASK
jgi:hypothetical protein